MKKLLSTAIATTLAATGLMATTAAFTTASADMAYNAGVMSQYIFRGQVQRGGASLMGGADYTNDSGLYAGTWLAQVGDEAQISGGASSLGTSNGLEVDLYGGIKKEFGGATLGAGFTSYQYTNKVKTIGDGKFDTAYNELNLSLAYGPITATVNPGYHEGVNGSGDKSYVFYSVKGEYEGFYALYGAFDKKADPTKGAASQFDGAAQNGGSVLKDGSYIQAGYKTSLGGLDIDAYVINSSKELNTVGGTAGKSDASAFSVSATKAF